MSDLCSDGVRRCIESGWVDYPRSRRNKCREMVLVTFLTRVGVRKETIVK